MANDDEKIEQDDAAAASAGDAPEAVTPADEPVADEAVAEEPAAAEEPAVAQEPAVAEEAAVEEPTPVAQEEASAAAASAEPVDVPSAPSAEPQPATAAAEPARPKRGPRPKPARKPAGPKVRGTYSREPRPETEVRQRKERRGVVVSSAGDKSITVRIDSAKPHPKYLKIVRRSRKFHAHDEQNQAKVGDVVRIVETRPLSKLKRWRLVEIVEVAR